MHFQELFTLADMASQLLKVFAVVTACKVESGIKRRFVVGCRGAADILSDQYGSSGVLLRTTEARRRKLDLDLDQNAPTAR